MRRRDDEIRDPDVRAKFQFADFDDLSYGDVEVRVRERIPGDDGSGFVPSYECGIYLAGSDTRVGRIGVRIGNTPWIVRYAGHIGYEIEPEHRGHRYAAQACRAILPIAAHHGLKTLWLTVVPENTASRRTCEIIGATLVDVVDVPQDSDMYEQGEQRKCRYRWDISGAAPPR